MKGACLALLLVVVFGVITSDGYNIVPVSEQINNERPCTVRNQEYQHGELTGDPCNRCRCSNSYQICNRMACYGLDGKPIDPYRA